MSQGHDLANGLKALTLLIDSMPDDSTKWNEAETRYNFINELIHSVLGWERSITRLERYEGGDYSDYELGDPPQVVIEAKRAGVNFEIPHEEGKGIVRSIQSLTVTSQEFKTAFLQVQNYCSKRSIPIAVISTSDQIIIFLGVRSDGILVHDGKCLVFSNHDEMKTSFAYIWQAISPSAVKNNELLKTLKSTRPPGVPVKLSMRITDYPRFRYGSELQKSLRMLSDLLIEDIPNTPDQREQFLKECYCENGALASNALLGKEILAARYAAMFPLNTSSPTVVKVKKAKNDKHGFSPEVIAEALGRRPIVILGDVGVGKTSFIRNLIYVRAMDEMQDALFIYIDLGSQANLGQDIKNFLIADIERQLREHHGIDIF